MTTTPFATTVAALVLSLPLVAQTGSFTNFGTGCPGSSMPRVCASANDTATSLQGLFFSQTSEVALEVAAMSTPTLVTGFEILSKAPFGKITVTGRLHLADASGRPLATEAASGQLTVAAATSWYRVTFAKALLVPANQKFFLSWSDSRVPFSQDIDWPVPMTGTNGTTYHRYSQSGAFSAGPFTNYPWSWRVLCSGGATQVPALGNTGTPKIGASYSVDLTKAKDSSVAILISGLSNTTWLTVPLPLDLAPLGAAGCKLLVSYDFLAGVATSATGTGSLSIPVPAQNTLIGLKLHHEWMVVDSGANALGFSFSDGGTATIGQ